MPRNFLVKHTQGRHFYAGLFYFKKIICLIQKPLYIYNMYNEPHTVDIEKAVARVEWADRWIKKLIDVYLSKPMGSDPAFHWRVETLQEMVIRERRVHVVITMYQQRQRCNQGKLFKKVKI